MRLAPRRRTPERVAEYAGILDGRHLWLHLPDGATATLTGDAGSFDLTGEVTDLLVLLPDTEAAYDVVAGGAPVAIAPLDEDSPTRIPVAPDGRTRFALERTPTGHLRIRRGSVPATAVLEAIEVRGEDVHLTLMPTAVRPGLHLLLLDTDDRVRSHLPVTAHDGHVEALIGVSDLPGGYFGILRLALGDDTAWEKVRRRDCSLVDAHRAVLLPELRDPDAPGEGDPVARFRWNPDSLLVLRVLEPEGGPTAPEASVTEIRRAR